MRYAIRLCLLLSLGFVFLCLSIVLYVIADTHRYIYSLGAAPNAEAALVLGASVTSKGVLSPVLKQRADAAIVLYTSGKVEKILVTGDDGTREHNEVYPVGTYLLTAGIPQEDIFLDHAGFDTYSSMYRARDVFAVTSVVVVSQRFHLPRAVFIARHLGLDAVGVDASKNESYFKNSLREIPASIKAIFDLSTYRKPKYLGPIFYISNSGVGTW